MSKSPSMKLVVVILVFLGVGLFLRAISKIGNDETVVSKNSIMKVDLEGVIFNGKKFLKTLKKYSDEKDIKAFVISINSPGGAVGPSQEIYQALNKIRTEFKKPVVCVSTNLIASGGYYSAMGCDKLVVAPGALVGSIGVIMEFINLEKLYDWAKVSRYTITSGKYKDSGAEYRAMRDDERELFQEMINDVYGQFRKTVQDSRKLDDKTMDAYADGRVFSGVKAVDLGFADQVGMIDDAVKLAAQMANLGDDYELFEPKKHRPHMLEMLMDNQDDEDSLNELSEKIKTDIVSKGLREVVRAQYLNQPFYLMPGYWQ